MTTLPAPSATLDPATVRFGPVRFSATRRVHAGLGEVPQTPTALGRALGMDARRVLCSLQRLVEAGQARKVLLPGSRYPGYVRCGVAGPEAEAPEVGRRILICLTEPRRVCEIAGLIGRSGSCTTGHLGSLMRRGLVVRLSRGRYALGPADPGQGYSDIARLPVALSGQARHALAVGIERQAETTPPNGG